MNDELLIELVKHYPVLYDVSQPKYTDSNYKTSIWRGIGRELKVDGTTCKTRWNSIRDNYRKYLKKVSTLSGPSAKKIKLYKYSEQVSFLKEYISLERESLWDMAGQHNEEQNEDYAQQYEDDENIGDDAGEPTVPDVILHENLDTHPFVSFEASRKSSSRKLAKKNIAPQQTDSGSLMSYLISKQENQTACTPPHPVDVFLASIAPTMKTLTPYYLNLAKSEIFATVQKYEMQMLMNQHSFEERTELSSNVSPSSSPQPSP